MPCIAIIIAAFVFMQPVCAIAGDNAGSNDLSDANYNESRKEDAIQFDYEFDPYYTSAGVYISLTDEPIKDLGQRSEFDIYKHLLLNSYVPRFLVIEASVNPMPIAGVLVKDGWHGTYEDAEVSNNLNLVQALTAGFEEPYALSLFLGNVVEFTEKGASKGGNKGYMGYLLSFGDKHIKDNELIDDKWVEFEAKIKGDREGEMGKLNWSFRVGSKIHEHPEITDTVYFSLRRSRLDYESATSMLRNSAAEYTIDLDNENFKAVRHYFLVEKKWPLKQYKMAASLGVGFIYDTGRKYSGSLKERGASENFIILIRPNVEF